MKKRRFFGLSALLFATASFLLTLKTKWYNPGSYLLLLAFMGISLFLTNEKALLSANVFFFAFFTYTVGIGPVTLMMGKVNFHYDYFKIILGGLLMFCWGNAVASSEKRVKTRKDKSMFRVRLSRLNILRMMFAVSLLASAYYLIRNRNYLLGGSLQSGRITAMAGNGLLLSVSQLSIVTIPMLYDLYQQSKERGGVLVSKFELLTDLSLASFMLLFSGFRTPVISLYACLAILYARRKRIGNGSIILWGVFSLVLVKLLDTVRSFLSGETLSAENMLLSLGVIGCLNLGYVFQTFPAKMAFQSGYTYLLNLKMLLPGPDPDFTLWLKDALGLRFSGGGVTPTILGEFYMNFDVTGIYLGMFLYGFLGVYVWRYFKRHSETFLGAFYVLQFAHSASGGISNVSVTVLLYTIVYWFVMMFPIYRKGNGYARQRTES